MSLYLGLEFMDDEFMESSSIFSMENKIGSGHSKSGQRKRWKKRFYFESDLLGLDFVSNKYAGYSRAQIRQFFEKIKSHLIRPKETEVHALNKVVMWLDWLHNRLSWKNIREAYQISEASAIRYVRDVSTAILKTFQGTQIISFPNEREKELMRDILKKRNAPMPDILFAFDGKDAICNGKMHSERLSYKYKFHFACFSVLFVVERVLGTVCAVNLNKDGKECDANVLKESSFYRNLERDLGNWLVIADTGYVNESGIAASVKTKDPRRSKYPKSFWRDFNQARNVSEVTFALFFANKFPLLNDWKCKSRDTFNLWAMNVICCVILYNFMKRKSLRE